MPLPILVSDAVVEPQLVQAPPLNFNRVHHLSICLGFAGFHLVRIFNQATVMRLLAEKDRAEMRPRHFLGQKPFLHLYLDASVQRLRHNIRVGPGFFE